MIDNLEPFYVVQIKEMEELLRSRHVSEGGRGKGWVGVE
jgi:hypothetical protein